MLDENTRQLDDFRKAQPWNDDQVESDVSSDEAKADTFSPQLQSQGFDMWALDMAQGPEQVLRFLCNNSHLHEIVSELPS